MESKDGACGEEIEDFSDSKVALRLRKKPHVKPTATTNDTDMPRLTLKSDKSQGHREHMYQLMKMKAWNLKLMMRP